MQDRIIKFRAWDQKSKVMVDQSYRDAWEVLREALALNLPVMQYTGLKDKNGKEIYEGDIIQRDGSLGEVKWRHFGFEQCMINTLGWWVIQEDGEVIGNIYENP